MIFKSHLRNLITVISLYEIDKWRIFKTIANITICGCLGRFTPSADCKVPKVIFKNLKMSSGDL